MGGRIALQFALNFPEQLIEQLIIESAAPGIADIKQREKRLQADLRLAEHIEENGAVWFANYWGHSQSSKVSKTFLRKSNIKSGPAAHKMRLMLWPKLYVLQGKESFQTSQRNSKI